MIMISDEQLKQMKENKENVICYRKLARATDEKYNQVLENWGL